MHIEIETLGQAILYKRCLLGITQRKLAATLGIDYTYLSKIENDSKLPGHQLLEKLETALQFNKGELAQLCGYFSEELDYLLRETVKLKGEEAVKNKLTKLLEE